MKTVAIIGGGFCGTVAAVNLARLAKSPLRIVIINHHSPPGRGVAYGTRQPEHLLNVAARNMSAFPDQPSHFVDWLGTRSEYADMPEAVLRESFIPRKTYGDYLPALLFWHARNEANSRVAIEFVTGEAVDYVSALEHALVVVQGHPTLVADKVLLATGNPPPADLPCTIGFEHPRFVANPWKPIDYGIADLKQSVVLLGAGLTMIDSFLTLASLNWEGSIYAVSRSGLLPHSHFHGIAYPDFPPNDAASLGLTALADLMRDHCERLRDRGENPAIVVDKLRPLTQQIWQTFSVAEKTRFLRDDRTRWNVFRHRVPRPIHEQVTTAIESGRLQVIKGNICELAGGKNEIKVRIEKGKGQYLTLEGGWVINCTGPLENIRNTNQTLYQKLFDRGLVQSDDVELGIKVDASFRVIDGGGVTSPYLHAIGPMLKGSLWETTAVPELRIQALQVAQAMLDSLQGESAPAWFAETWYEVIEYVI